MTDTYNITNTVPVCTCSMSAEDRQEAEAWRLAQLAALLTEHGGFRMGHTMYFDMAVQYIDEARKRVSSLHTGAL